MKLKINNNRPIGSAILQILPNSPVLAMREKMLNQVFGLDGGKPPGRHIMPTLKMTTETILNLSRGLSMNGEF